MDIASFIGLLTAIGLIVASIVLGEAPVTSFLHVPSGLVVVGGSTAAMLICFPLRSSLRLPAIMGKVLRNSPPEHGLLIRLLVSLADTARRDGLLALENRIDEIDNDLVRTGVQLAVDGNAPEAVEDVLRTEVATIASRHLEGRSMLEQLSRFAPAYGMIGTLMGLIMMLSDMGDPSKIGHGMAIALITTLYGAIAANVVFTPFAEKLKSISRRELVGMEMAIRGVMAIQSGESPRGVEQKLRMFLSPSEREQNEPIFGKGISG